MYSFDSVPYYLHVRLDRFLCTPTMLGMVISDDYLSRLVSDHDAHVVDLTWNDPLPPVPLLRLPRDALDDQAFPGGHSPNILKLTSA